MLFVDSSVLIAFLNEADALHDRALAAELGDGVINQLVLAEVANVLQKRVRNKHAALGAVKEVLDNVPIISLENDDVAKCFKVFADNFPKISFTDASLLFQAKKHGARLVTFDEELKALF